MNLLQRTHRFAGFAVLKSLDIPSVLIEMGYLSNLKDSKLLNDKNYHNKICDDILKKQLKNILNGKIKILFRNMFKNLLSFIYIALIGFFSLFFVIIFVFYFFGKDLPSFDKLSYYQPRLVSKFLHQMEISWKIILLKIEFLVNMRKYQMN